GCAGASAEEQDGAEIGCLLAGGNGMDGNSCAPKRYGGNRRHECEDRGNQPVSHENDGTKTAVSDGLIPFSRRESVYPDLQLRTEAHFEQQWQRVEHARHDEDVKYFPLSSRGSKKFSADKKWDEGD